MALHPNLSFEQAPPLSAPMRFFLTAPWFGVAAGVVLAHNGASALASRWMPETLALVHLFVAGFMLQAMCGALLQFVPVAAGGNVWRPRWVAAIVHPLLTVGAAVLALGFLFHSARGFITAASLLAATLVFFASVVLFALFRTTATSPTVHALRIAVSALLVTAILGATLALGLGRGAILPFVELTNLHAGWGLSGWALILLAGVSYYVVPMFQLTPPYPSWFARAFAWLLVSLLLLWAAAFAHGGVAETLAVLLVFAAAGYGATTLWLQARRRRKLTDPTFLFFRTAMFALLLLAAGMLASISLPLIASEPRVSVWLGALAIHGVFVSAIEGMLYKIVPFIGWLHLQRACPLGVLPPTMNQLLTEKAMRGQLYAHWAALAVLLAAVWLPSLARPAGLLLAGESAWLGYNLIVALANYRRFRDRIRAAASDRGS